MRYENDLEKIGKDREKLISFLKEYENIRCGLEKELLKDNRSILYADLISLMIKISDHILRKEDNLRKGVGDVMGGKVLELESERLMRIGRTEGKAEGKIEGENFLGKLITLLFAEGRTADAQLAAKDEEARERLYREFGMID